MYFFHDRERVRKERRPGIHIRTMWGDKLLLSYIDLEANADIPAHSHPEEQFSIVLRGAVTMTVGGETRELTAGDVYLVPANVEHGGRVGPEPAQIIDVYTPVRKDLQF